MSKAAYQRFLQRLYNRMEGAAWKALQREDDPARFNRLRRLNTAGTKQHTRREALKCLYSLEAKPDKKPFDAWCAIVWAGQARIPAPDWAVRQLDEIGHRYMYDETLTSLDRAFGVKADRKQKLLDKALGFRTAGGGRKPRT